MMETHKIRRLPVVDDQGSLVGIISLADIARHTNDEITASLIKQVSTES
jgi:CBS domain-containing protein